MKFHIILSIAFIALLGSLLNVSAQVDSVIGQVTNNAAESFAGGTSGDGRFIVFESSGNLATENPRNADGNREIFLFDYAQRRIFQITNTTSLRTSTTVDYTQANIKVLIVNARPTISNDGRFIAFSSNATTAYPGNGTLPPIVSTSNPGNFNADSFNVTSGTTTTNSLTNDGNTEVWLYEIPAVTAADLTSGEEIAYVDLSAGTFTQVTNSVPSRLPSAGTAAVAAQVGDDNRDVSINDNGNILAFTSNRDLRPDATFGNASPNNNDEIFTYSRTGNVINQITVTVRGTIVDPNINQNPTISGLGTRVAFFSNANNPIRQMTGDTNSDRNVEIFYADLDGTGATTATSVKRQVTNTTRTAPGGIVNVLDPGRRLSRDGRYIAFDSFADLAGENSGANQAGFATFVFDAEAITPTPAFRRVGPRSDADTAANGGDVAHYPTFTDTDANGKPSTLILGTRANITAAGTVATSSETGLNPDAVRTTQIYAYSLSQPTSSATFTRLSKFPSANTFIPSTQALTSNSRERFSFNLSFVEIGTGNADFQSEVYYYLLPAQVNQSPAGFSYATGATRIPVSASPVPTPSATPTPSPSPSVSPTPSTPNAVQGVSPGMLAVLSYTSGISEPVIARTAVGSINRRFTLPIQLSGATLTVNGAAAGIQSVSQRQVVFVVPPALFPADNNPVVYPVVLNIRGTVFRGSITVVPSRPDIFTFAPMTTPVGNPPRAGIGVNRAQLYDATNPVLRTEPFNITTRKIRGGIRVPTVFRLYLTGVESIPSANISIRVGSFPPTTAPTVTSSAVTRAPGVQSIDFTLPAAYQNIGDVPIVVTITVGGITYTSRLDDSAPRTRIL